MGSTHGFHLFSEIESLSEGTVTQSELSDEHDSDDSFENGSDGTDEESKCDQEGGIHCNTMTSANKQLLMKEEYCLGF